MSTPKTIPRGMKADSALIGTTGLRERGWTSAMVRDLLGEPDETRRNPVYYSAAPMKLWSMERVLGAEASVTFADRKTRGQQRAARSRATAERKRDELIGEITANPVPVRVMNRDTLIRRACKHYNAFLLERGWDGDPATPDSDPGFLDRIAVNYLRHELTDYEERLSMLYRRTGRAAAYQVLREKVLEAIGVAYPWLTAECRRQVTRAELLRQQR